jgi:hypothetical protein
VAYFISHLEELRQLELFVLAEDLAYSLWLLSHQFGALANGWDDKGIRVNTFPEVGVLFNVDLIADK